MPFFLARSVAMDRVTSSLGRWVGRWVVADRVTSSPGRSVGRWVGRHGQGHLAARSAGRFTTLVRPVVDRVALSLARSAGRSVVDRVGHPGDARLHLVSVRDKEQDGNGSCAYRKGGWDGDRCTRSRLRWS